MRISRRPVGCRAHLRGHTNILKRLLVHSGAFNLRLLMRTLIGVGTPRGLQGRQAALIALVVALWSHIVDLWQHRRATSGDHSSGLTPHHRFERFPVNASEDSLNHGLLGCRRPSIVQVWVICHAPEPTIDASPGRTSYVGRAARAAVTPDRPQADRCEASRRVIRNRASAAASPSGRHRLPS
jgi:hypothetical protein